MIASSFVETVAAFAPHHPIFAVPIADEMERQTG